MWASVPLKAIAPPRPSRVRLDLDDQVWHLSLDQVESRTGIVVGRVMKPVRDAGTSTFVFDQGNVLYAKLRPYLNKVVCPDEIGISTTEMVPLRPIGTVVDRRYLAYFLRSDTFVRFASQAVAGVKMPRVIMDKFWRYQVPLPALSEQRRIVEILDEADRLRRQRRETDAKVARILPALFHKTFGDPATNPMGWDKGCVGDVVIETQYGTSTRASENGTGIPVLRMNNIDIAGNLDLTDLKYVELSEKQGEKYRLVVGDILFNRTNSRELVGKTGLWRGEFEAVPASYLIRVRVDRTKVLPEYLWAHMNSPFVKSLLFGKSRRAIGMANINARELRALPIVIPPIPVQESFVEQLQTVTLDKTTREASRERIQRLFDVLLHRAFTGELTAGWRERHKAKLEAELAEQLKAIEAAKSARPTGRRKRTRKSKIAD